MITELLMSEFKAFHHERIQLRPLTVFVGENNSGKSSVLAAIRLLAQTIQDPDPTIPLLFDGPYGDYGSFRDVVNGNHRGRPMSLGLSTTMSSRPSASKSSSPVGFASEFKYRTQRRETILRSTRLLQSQRSVLGVERPRDSERVQLSSIGGLAIPAEVRSQLRDPVRLNNFLPILRPLDLVYRDEQPDGPVFDRWRSSYMRARRISDYLSRALRSVEVIGAMRQPPPRTSLHSGAVSEKIGVAGENWAGLVALATSGRSRQSFLAPVISWLRSAGIAEDLEVSWLSDRHFELNVKHPVSGESENILDVGRGTSQVLPVLIGGYRLTSGDTYLVEEPEIHLHPRAQAELGDFFQDLTARGVQSIIETHSEYLITRVQQHVASGKLDPDDVIFYYVGANANGKRLTKLELTEKAVFADAIPGGFFPQRMAEANRLVKARGERAKK